MQSSSTESDSDFGYPSSLLVLSGSSPTRSTYKLPSITDLPLSESQTLFFNQIQAISPNALDFSHQEMPRAISAQLTATKMRKTPSASLMVAPSNHKKNQNSSSHSKSSWSQEEDEVLLNAVSGKSNINWDYIASIDGKHTPKQCRERWLVKLNPEVRRSPFESWEDDLIQSERQKIGNHWSLIAQLLPGRTSCSVKNRWYTVLRYRPNRNPVVPNFPTMGTSMMRSPIHRNVFG